VRLGIDFGTTNSAIALYDDGKLTPVIVGAEEENPDVLPSLIYITREGDTIAGMPAARAYLQRETGRPVKWERRYVGTLDMLVSSGGSSPILVTEEIWVQIDVAANGRLLQSIKSALRDPAYEGSYIFDRWYTLDELIAVVLEALKVAAETQLGKPCDGIVMGRPVKFSDDPEIDARASEILYKAARWVGFENISFEMEPVGVSYLHHISSPARHTALVFDFGGGTLDLTVARLGGDARPEILAQRGVLVGGDDLDMRIMQSLLKYFGQGSTVDGYPFPHDMLDLLLKWQTMPEISRPQYMERIREFRRPSKPQAVEALKTLVTQNVGYKLFTEIERVKKALSTSIIEKLDFSHGAIQIREVITRNQFEGMIEAEIAKVEEGIWDVVDQSGLAPGEIDVVLRTGGSSLVPAFINMLERIFGEGKVRDVAPLVSVVGGLAIAAQENGRRSPGCAVRYEDSANILLSDIRTGGSSRYEKYRMRIGALAYINSKLTVTHCPLQLSGLPAIRPATDDRDVCTGEFLRFTLSRPARVFVAYEASAVALPGWLQTFEPELEYIEVKGEWMDETPMKLYGRDFPAGEVVLGGNRPESHEDAKPLTYLVIVRAEA
jgi:hypothetical chaperone protein